MLSTPPLLGLSAPAGEHGAGPARGHGAGLRRRGPAACCSPHAVRASEHGTRGRRQRRQALPHTHAQGAGRLRHRLASAHPLPAAGTYPYVAYKPFRETVPEERVSLATFKHVASLVRCARCLCCAWHAGLRCCCCCCCRWVLGRYQTSLFARLLPHCLVLAAPACTQPGSCCSHRVQLPTTLATPCRSWARATLASTAPRAPTRCPPTWCAQRSWIACRAGWLVTAGAGAPCACNASTALSPTRSRPQPAVAAHGPQVPFVELINHSDDPNAQRSGA